MEEINDNQSLILVEKKFFTLDSQNWDKLSLRQCLLELGLTDKEMRYRKGARYVLQDWTGEEKTLLELVKKKWKAQVVQHHEATGNNSEQWKIVNSLYSAILKKITKYIREKRDTLYVEYECFICKKEIKKKVITGFEWNSKLCSDENCKRLYHNYKAKKRRSLFKQTFEIKCQGPNCDVRFFTTNKNRKYHNQQCHKNKIKSMNYSRGTRKSWKEWFYSLTEEQRDLERANARIKTARLLEKESDEQREKRLEKCRIRRKLKRQNMTPEQREIEKQNRKKYLFGPELIAKKKEQWKDKPWIFETWLQQQSKDKK